MSTPADAQNHLTERQDKLWFRISTITLAIIFIVAGGVLSWSQLSAKREDRANQRLLMDPAVQDPGRVL